MTQTQEHTGAASRATNKKLFARPITFIQKYWQVGLAAIGLILLMAWTRLTALNQYLIVDEPDRWRWANEFVLALNQGDLAGTLVGDGYPGIVPVWAESVWILIEVARRSLIEGQWIGEIGLGHLLHEWDRTEVLFQQRLPIVLLNIVIGLAIVWLVWRLFGPGVALVSGIFVALDPFYLSDSRVNRAEAVITGLMTLSILSLILYYQKRRFRYVIISGILGGLSFLTKIQALTILPVVALTGLLIFFVLDNRQNGATTKEISLQALRSLLIFGLGWVAAAGITWFLLWPSMWVTPLETLSLVYNYTTRKVGTEGVNLFFLGQTYQDADPGLLFYPVVFFLRITPLVLVGLVGAVGRFAGQVLTRGFGRKKADPLPDDPFAVKGSSILVVFVLLYALIMSFGSHKQDRYLMPIFLGVDILAAMGLVYLWVRVKNKFLLNVRDSRAKVIEGALVAVLVVVQAATVLPHHPYYYSYFNPLFGGGQTAVNTLRIGWGEGMDQVGTYLAAKPDSRDLVVSSRFTHNMLDFKGERIALGGGGSWTRADYIVLYIQQVQRRLESERGFIDYFQAREPEKVITIGGIDYAWIYPTPFTVPANPQVSLIPDQAALLGYSWESNPSTHQPTIRLVWENLGFGNDRQLAVRLVDATAATEWAVCRPDPAFSRQVQTVGAYVESLCTPALETLPLGHYTVEFSLIHGEASKPFLFPEGWQAARLTAAGEVTDTPDLERLEAIAEQSVPAEASPLDRIYDGRIRLVAYQLDPPQPKPGDTAKLTLYWQAVKEVSEAVHLTVQLADSRSISLGRNDRSLPSDPEKIWFPGEVVVTRHDFPLAPELDAPLAARIEVELRDKAKIPLLATTLSGNLLDAIMGRFTISPATWPALDVGVPVQGVWQSDDQLEEITLTGYKVSLAQPKAGDSLSVNLYWRVHQPTVRDYVVFVHLLDDNGQIKAQSDSLPRAGAYPTTWWLPGKIVEDIHAVSLPDDLPDGVYRLVVGLYRSEDGQRLLLTDHSDSLFLDTIEIQ